MQLAYAAGRVGSMPAVPNAANEQAVALFLEEKIQFDIPRCIEWCAIATSDNQPTSLDDIVAADQWARQVLTAKIDC